MATLSEHADAIRAAIEAARLDGFVLESNLYYDHDGAVTDVDWMIHKYSKNGLGHNYIAQYDTINSEDRFGDN